MHRYKGSSLHPKADEKGFSVFETSFTIVLCFHRPLTAIFLFSWFKSLPPVRTKEKTFSTSTWFNQVCYIPIGIKAACLINNVIPCFKSPCPWGSCCFSFLFFVFSFVRVYLKSPSKSCWELFCTFKLINWICSRDPSRPCVREGKQEHTYATSKNLNKVNKKNGRWREVWKYPM